MDQDRQKELQSYATTDVKKALLRIAKEVKVVSERAEELAGIFTKHGPVALRKEEKDRSDKIISMYSNIKYLGSGGHGTILQAELNQDDPDQALKKGTIVALKTESLRAPQTINMAILGNLDFYNICDSFPRLSRVFTCDVRKLIKDERMYSYTMKSYNYMATFFEMERVEPDIGKQVQFGENEHLREDIKNGPMAFELEYFNHAVNSYLHMDVPDAKLRNYSMRKVDYARVYHLGEDKLGQRLVVVCPPGNQFVRIDIDREMFRDSPLEQIYDRGVYMLTPAEMRAAYKWLPENSKGDYINREFEFINRIKIRYEDLCTTEEELHKKLLNMPAKHFYLHIDDAIKNNATNKQNSSKSTASNVKTPEPELFTKTLYILRLVEENRVLHNNLVNDIIDICESQALNTEEAKKLRDKIFKAIDSVSRITDKHQDDPIRKLYWDEVFEKVYEKTS